MTDHFMKHAVEIISKYQKYFLGLAIFLSLCAVSVRISKGDIELHFREYPILMIFLVSFSLMLIIVYIRVDAYKIKKLAYVIQVNFEHETENFESLLQNLTSRQAEVYELIASGKSNKEIMSALFIEQSTLKTHINQIYKKLKIKNRRELKRNLKS